MKGTNGIAWGLIASHYPSKCGFGLRDMLSRLPPITASRRFVAMRCP